MKKAVKVKPCCWVCEFSYIDPKGDYCCRFRGKLPRYVTDYVCEDFKLWEYLEPEEVIE